MLRSASRKRRYGTSNSRQSCNRRWRCAWRQRPSAWRDNRKPPARHLVVVAAWHVTDPSRLAHAGTVQCEGVNAATRELSARKKDAHLLSIVHAVYDDDRRRGKAIRGRLHEQRWQRGCLIGHLDEFDRRFTQADAGMPAMIRFSGLRSLFRARRDETLGVVVINAGAQIVVAGADLVALRQRRIGAALELRAHRAPLFSARPSDSFLGAPSVSHRRGRSPRARPAIRRHALQDQRCIGPKKVIAEIGRSWSTGHENSFRKLVDLCVHR